MTAKQQCEALMNELLPLAEKMLRQYGEFYPYGGYMEGDGNIVHVGAGDPDSNHPKSKDLIYVLRDSFRELASSHKCKAVAILFDVKIKLRDSAINSDAIQVYLDHKDGYSVDVFFPYEITNHQIVYKETFAEEGKHDIFEAT